MKNVLRIKEQLPPITDSGGTLAISGIEKAIQTLNENLYISFLYNT